MARRVRWRSFRAARAVAEHVEALVEQPDEVGQPKRGHPTGGELERQRHAVEGAAHLRDVRRVPRLLEQVVVDEGGAVEEDRGSRVLAQRRRRHHLAGGHDRERADPEDPLALHAERHPARRDHPGAGCGGEHVGGSSRGGVEHVLAVVEHQQVRDGREVLTDGGTGVHPLADLDAEGERDGVDDGPGVAGCREVDEGHRQPERGHAGVRVGERLDDQPGLADPARPDRGDQAVLGEQPAEPPQLLAPPAERAVEHREGPQSRGGPVGRGAVGGDRGMRRAHPTADLHHGCDELVADPVDGADVAAAPGPCPRGPPAPT